MDVTVIRETVPYEQRVASRLGSASLSSPEPDSAHRSRMKYRAAGATIADNSVDILARADILLKVQPLHQ